MSQLHLTLHWNHSLSIYKFISLSLFSVNYICVELIVFVVSVIILCLCFFVIKPYYYKIAFIDIEQSNNVKSKYYKFKKRPIFLELILNEFRLVFRSGGYLFGYFLFPLFMPLIVYTYDKLLISIAVNTAGKGMVIGAHMLILLIISLMSNIISSIAISKDGSNFYLSKTIPVSYYTQVKAKITFNFLITGIAIIVTTITTLIFSNLNTWFVISSSMIALTLSL